MGIKRTVETFSLPDVFQNLAANHQTGCLRVYMEAPPPDTRATLATGRQPTAANMQEPATPPNGTSASGRPATDGTGTRASKQTIVAAGHEKLVYFDNGVAQFVSRGLGRPLLHAEVFLARGHINQEQLAAALARSQEVSKSAVLCLVELGTVAPETVDEVARLVIEEEIYDLFGWEKAHFEFNPGPLPEGLFAGQIMGAPPSLPITHLIMEGARRMDEWDRLRRAIGSFKDIFIVDPAARKAIEKGEMETDPIEKRVVSLVDGTRDVDDVLAESFLFKFEVLDALARLLQSSLARPASLSELALAEQECTRLTLPKRRVKVLERMLAVGGENARVRRELAEALAREDRVDTACIHYLVLAENEVAATRMDSAVELFKRILSLSPRHAKAHEHLGGIYAKRGHKREAFVHFQALYEALREQTHNREARAAAIAALDCDPAHVEMRTGLIELYLADNQKDAAVQHLEVLGDQAARAGNIKLAADSYRRAIQFAPANKNLKRKLADAMLTREDRLARKRRILVAALVITVTSLVAGAAAVKEYLNANAFSAADRDARGLAAAGEQLEQEGRFSEARERYEAAVQRYLPAANLFSPVMGYQKQAARQINELRSLSQQAARKAEEVRTDRLDDIKKKMASAETATQNKHYKKARDLYAEILNMPEAAEEERKTAQAGRDKAQKVLDDYDKVIRRLNNPDQNAEFQNVDEEAAWKRWALEEYRAFPEFKRESVELPLLIQPDTDGVQVLLDGRQAGTVNAGGGREANIFRYPAGGSHQFEFRKAGFKTVTAITAALRSATLPIRMERAPAVRVDLRGQLGADVRLAGEPACNGATLYLGTSEGSLVEFSGQE
jgi:Flp pilus assembly protein TadD